MISVSVLAEQARKKSWLIWSVGVGVYLLAVFHRTSLGVAGPLATERLGLSAGQLSTFVMLQLGVYAAMQVPTGILVDRFGPRRMLLVATVIMGSAQLLFSQVESYPLALLARGLLGCGDAMALVSVLRLAAGWFPARRYPVLVTFTGLVGMAGNVVATVPLTLLLTGLGWGPTFAIAGGMSLGYGLLLLRPRWLRRTGRPNARTARSVAAGCLPRSHRPGGCRPAGWRYGSTCRRWPGRPPSPCSGASHTSPRGLATRPRRRRLC